MNIRKTVSTTLLSTIAMVITLIVVIAVLKGCHGAIKPIEEAISLFGNYFGGITTLVAAYIASKLFNAWEDQHNANIKISLINKLLEACDSHELIIYKGVEEMAKVKEKLTQELKTSTLDNDYNSINSKVHDIHASFLWGKNIINKHLLCIDEEIVVGEKININQIITENNQKSKAISDLYMSIINKTDINEKIRETDKLNGLMSEYLAFINIDIYMNLSPLRFEKKY